MALITRYFSTTGAGTEDGTSWANRAAFYSAGTCSSIITSFNFAGSDSLEVRLGAGTHSTSNNSFTSALFTNAPRPANPLTIYGCDSNGDRIIPPVWNCCQGPLPVSNFPLWDLGTGSVSLANIIIACVSLQNNSASGTVNASGTFNLGNGMSLEFCKVENSGGQSAAFGTTATAHSCHFKTTATTYGNVVAGGAIHVQNCRIEGNPGATSGNRRGIEGTVAGILRPASKNCILDCPGSAIINTNGSAGNGLVATEFTIVNCATVNGAAIDCPNPPSGVAATGHNVVYSKNCFIANCGLGISTVNTAARLFNNRLRNTSNYSIPTNSIVANDYVAAGSDTDEFVDAASGDYRIKKTSIYWGKNLGAGDEPGARPTSPFYTGIIG